MAEPTWEELDQASGRTPPVVEAPPDQRGWGQAIWDTAKTVGQTADDTVRAAADTITFGMLDRALGGDEVKKTLEARERSPYATTLGDVGGAIATPGMGVIGRGVSTAAGGAGAGIRAGLGRAVGYGTEGAIVGGAQGAGHTYDLKDLPANVGWGAGIGGVTGAITGPLARVEPTPRAAVPTEAELAERYRQQTGELNRSPVQYSPSNFYQTIDDNTQRLLADRLHPGNVPETYHAIDFTAPARNPPPGNTAVIQPREIANFWEQLSNAQGHGGKEAIAAGRTKAAVDQYLANPVSAIAGTDAEVAAALRNFRESNANWAGMSRSNLVTSADRSAENASSAAHSGLNYENTVRRKLAPLLEDKTPNPLMGFNAAERQAVQDLVTRSTGPNFVRYAGNLIGAGGGLGTTLPALVVGGATGLNTQDPKQGMAAALATVAGGRAMRGLGNRAMQREVDAASSVLRERTPMFAERQAATPGTNPGPGHAYTPTRQTIEGARNALALELMRQQRGDKEPLRITVNPRRGN